MQHARAWRCATQPVGCGAVSTGRIERGACGARSPPKKAARPISKSRLAELIEQATLIASRTPKGYEQAVALLADLRAAAALVKRDDAFSARLRELRQGHASKPSLIKRLDVAGLR